MSASVNTSTALLKNLTRCVVNLSSKSFSTSPIQVPLTASRTFIQKTNLAPRIAVRNVYSHPLAMGNPYYEENELAEMNPMTLLHFEAMERWREEAKKMYDIMDTSDITEAEKKPEIIAEDSKYQVKSLIEEMIDEDLLDPRLSWTASVDY